MMTDNEKTIAEWMDTNLEVALLFQFGQHQSTEHDFINGYHRGKTEGMLSQYLTLGAVSVELILSLDPEKCFQ